MQLFHHYLITAGAGGREQERAREKERDWRYFSNHEIVLTYLAVLRCTGSSHILFPINIQIYGKSERILSLARVLWASQAKLSLLSNQVHETWKRLLIKWNFDFIALDVLFCYATYKWEICSDSYAITCIYPHIIMI